MCNVSRAHGFNTRGRGMLFGVSGSKSFESLKTVVRDLPLIMLSDSHSRRFEDSNHQDFVL